MTIPINQPGTTLAWGINTTMTQEPTRKELKEMEEKGEVAKKAIGDYEGVRSQPLRSLLDGIVESRIWAPYSLPDLKTWHSVGGRVGLIGDAAHALPPNGQGSAMAFEDAAILSRLLLAHSKSNPESTGPTSESYRKMFEKFEEVRRPRIEGMRKKGKVGQAFKGQTSSWVWWGKKWAFRAFFWWNGGVVRFLDETRYDVDEVDIGEGE
ncbi:hypothetical protein P7C70_g2872, partial [Phenoliferia sp. Uapishka_3]